jgi:hypothetical protein
LEPMPATQSSTAETLVLAARLALQSSRIARSTWRLNCSQGSHRLRLPDCPDSRRMLANFPQACSHVGLINCALSLSRHNGHAEERAVCQGPKISVA